MIEDESQGKVHWRNKEGQENKMTDISTVTRQKEGQGMQGIVMKNGRHFR
jgi:hypothetical protein